MPPTNKERIDDLEARLKVIERSLGIRHVKKDIPWPLLGSALAVVVTIIIAAIGATHVVDTKLNGLEVGSQKLKPP